MALLCLLVGAVFIATTPILIRLSELDPISTAFYRMLFALPAMGLWSAFEKRGGAASSPASSPVAGGGGHWGLVLVGVFLAADLVVWYWSVRLTSVANATLLVNTAPLYATLGGFVLFGERFSKTFLLGMALALGGAFVLMGESIRVDLDNLLGDGLALLAAGLYAAYIMGVGKLRARFSSATILLWSCGVAALLLLPVAAAFGDGLVAATLFGWAVLVALALVSHVGGHGFLVYALGHLPAAFSTVGLLLQPVFASAFAWIILNEAVGGWQAVGAAVVMAGIFVAQRGTRLG